MIKCIYPQGDNRRDRADEQWTTQQTAQSVISWRGIAFEEVCMNHIPQIKQTLGISGIDTEESAWTVQGDDERKGAQIPG